MIDHIPDDFGHWLAGFVDGEGSFNLTLGKRPKHIPSCQFSISLRNDDADTLEYIIKVLGRGTVYYRERGEINKQGYMSKPRADLMMHTKADVKLIAAIFRKYPLRSKKRLAFVPWAEAVDLWSLRNYNGPMTDEKWRVAEQMQDLMRQVKEARQYHTPQYPD